MPASPGQLSIQPARARQVTCGPPDRCPGLTQRRSLLTLYSYYIHGCDDLLNQQNGHVLEQLAHSLLAKPDESVEAYGRIQNRGMAQVLFRQALLAAYTPSGARNAYLASLGSSGETLHSRPGLRPS